MKKPDLLVFLSDQHHARYTGYAGHETVRTPYLDQLAQEGTFMCAAYTTSPLCVPSRVSMLTGQLPEKTGVYTNHGAVGSDQATFLHGIAAEGYETVLCGRMHFMGEDQRHGFTKRIMSEMTPLFWGRYGAARSDLGPYVGTMANQSLKIIGGGTSPVLEYDKAVIKAALDYLKQDHEKPQCIFIGTYGPHHTFVAPPERYMYYKERVDIPESFRLDEGHPVLQRMRTENKLTEDNVIKLRAAYMGMIETIDSQVGEVRGAWSRYLERSGRQGVFIYMSDHGEQAGEHGLIGKNTLYEGSAKIPMIVEGTGVSAGRRVEQPVSIMDLGPTLCAYAGAGTPPRQDGISLKPLLENGAENPERYIVSECMATLDSRPVPGRMLRQGNWKYVAYAFHEQYNQLFDLSADPQELHNLAQERSDVAGHFEIILKQTWDTAGIIEKHLEKAEHHKLLAKWGKATDVPELERWPVPVEATVLPVVE